MLRPDPPSRHDRRVRSARRPGRYLGPEDTSRPVDARMLLVKIALLEPTPLKLGQRVEVLSARLHA